jgi:nucleotide-binding universal stress UspA family protein
VLRRHWPDADFAVVDQTPVEGVLAAARRGRARAVVVGVRGQGAIGRFVLGSVSRGVVRRAPCAVLVVKGRPREIRRLVVGLDGSAHSRRAVAFVSGLDVPPGGRVVLVRIVEPVRPPTTGLLPAAVRAVVAGQAARLEAQRRRAAQGDVAAARRRLERSGWTVRSIVRAGVPLPELFRAVSEARADVLVVGGRGVGGIERILLGSVAEGALSRSPVSVLIVR